MALFYLIRHGQPDYSGCDERKYKGHGRDLAPLSEKGIEQVIETSKDARLKDAQLIVCSPYTRAMQTASIISKQLSIDIKVEMDLHEWMPDLTFTYDNLDECLELTNDYNKCHGEYPKDEEKRWESLSHLRNRVRAVADKYASYDKVIIVGHGMALKTLTYIEHMTPAEIVECTYELNQPNCIVSFT
ncbi:histidine phosphatase family protein [Sedimentibacter sp. zth1]|uniref:histidine phosphatase family protein n=1 Tax=Sedimentibacter sp. zth1 TaxID=2816908 RepID=UPI001A9274E2|nr:histidine phosphatase family protein [Sedimentibacter sp. zth1]QSX06746.1 histidine phosphatase family protein [Sedimentibacter sp. zth1]